MPYAYRNPNVQRAARVAAFGEHRKHIKGDIAFRKLLKRLPESMKDSMVVMLEELGGQVLTAMQAATPVGKTGALRSGLSVRVLRASMRLKVGLIGRPLNRRLFYGRIVNYGRRAQTVTVHRLSKGQRKQWHKMVGKRQARMSRKPTSLGSVYQLRVRGKKGTEFVSGQRKAMNEVINVRINKFWDRTLAAASAGATDA